MVIERQFGVRHQQIVHYTVHRARARRARRQPAYLSLRDCDARRRWHGGTWCRARSSWRRGRGTCSTHVVPWPRSRVYRIAPGTGQPIRRTDSLSEVLAFAIALHIRYATFSQTSIKPRRRTTTPDRYCPVAWQVLTNTDGTRSVRSNSSCGRNCARKMRSQSTASMRLRSWV